MENGNGNGNGIKKEFDAEIKHQEELANVEHEQMRSSINELKSKYDEGIKHVYGKIDDITSAIDSKHKFILTIIVVMLAGTYAMTYDGDARNKSDLDNRLAHLDNKLHEIELALHETDEIVTGNDKLLNAIVEGHVVLKTDYEQYQVIEEVRNEKTTGGGY